MLRAKFKSGAWFIAKAAISIAFLFYATRKIDLTSFIQDVRTLNLWWLFLGLAQLLLIPILGGARWHLVLTTLGSSISTALSTRVFWIGMIFSQVLPSSSGGDAIRVVLVWREGVPFAQSAHSVILERLAMLFTLVILVAFMQLLAGYKMNIPAAAWIGPLLLCGAVAGMFLVTFGDALFIRLPSWKVLWALSRLSVDARKVLLSSSCARLAGLSMVTHLNIAIACLWLGKSIGLHLSILDYVFYISLTTLVTALPLSIGGWGIREGALVALLGGAGVLAHSALAFSILFGLSVAAISLSGLPFVSFKKARQQVSATSNGMREIAVPTIEPLP
ncbi:MAG TPA: lysylphosphatidylglycerol synthase transmembrane domain-containing protein [Steroidobacteraceae bacterium]|jgi:hypothetical protein|nr:lysylphosphatidylglycerol synthase transmembrane domain-containing protein [Steroidobacteraceae bacterium]